MTADFARHMKAVARHLLGEPNKDLSSKTEWRYGNRGSLSVNLAKGVWKDHENGDSGGVLALIKREKGLANGVAVEWLKDELGIRFDDEERDGKRGKGRKPRGRITDRYLYIDEAGATRYRVNRWKPKRFSQERYDAGEWIGGEGALDGVPRVLYRLREVLDADPAETVFLTEGEKDADRLRSQELLATTTAQGASCWAKTDTSPLTGRHVVVLPDNDAAGSDYERAATADLVNRAASLRVVRLPNLPPKGDVSDWLDAGGTKEELLRLVAETPLYQPVTPEPDEPERVAIHVTEERINDAARACAALLKDDVFLRGQFARVAVRIEDIATNPADDGEEETGFMIGGVRHARGTLILTEPSLGRLQYRLDERAVFQRYDGRSEQWVARSCPTSLVRRVTDAAVELGFRTCAGIVAVPLFHDGEVIATNGYHAPTRNIIDLKRELPPIPDQPTKDDAEKALDVILAPFRGYLSNAEGEERGKFRSMLATAVLTAALRPSLPAAPVILIDANIPAAGKGKLARSLGVINSGRLPAILTEGHDEKETEKRLSAAILSGTSSILLDNAQHEIASSTLESGLTEGFATIRAFGKLDDLTVPCNALTLITGNNVALRADMLRRVLPLRIVVPTHEPERRVFGFDPYREAKANRPAILAAAFTIARAWWLARETAEAKAILRTTLGSFEEWAALVAGAAQWLTGLNPIDVIDERKRSDPRKADERALMEALVKWQRERAVDGHGTWWAARDAAEAINANLWAEVITFKGDKPSPKQVSGWLRKRKDTVFSNGLMLSGKLNRLDTMEWSVREPPQASQASAGFASTPEDAKCQKGGVGGYDNLRSSGVGKACESLQSLHPDDDPPPRGESCGNGARDREQAAAWSDDRSWSPRLNGKTREQRRAVMAEWITAAGGTLRDIGGTLVAELPELPPCLALKELRRHCQDVGIEPRTAVQH